MNVIHILLQNFAKFLQDTGASANTARNYLADINVFFRYLSDKQQPVSFLTLDSLLSSSSQNNYHHYLLDHFPTATVKRRISSLNKFSQFVKNSHLVTPVTPISSFQSPASVSSSLPSPLPPISHSKSNSPFLYALFVLLIISVSIMSGYFASRFSKSSIIGLVDPSAATIYSQPR